MRRIDYIAVHCTASRPSTTAEDLKRHFKALGWSMPGYHYLIAADGSITQLLDEKRVANGIRGFNAHCIHVAYIGGLNARHGPADTRTKEQRTTLRCLLERLHTRYPTALIRGHRDFSTDKNKDGVISPDEWIKTCPCFDVQREFSDLQPQQQS